jgi:hypothetical protein
MIPFGGDGLLGSGETRDVVFTWTSLVEVGAECSLQIRQLRGGVVIGVLSGGKMLISSS